MSDQDLTPLDDLSGADVAALAELTEDDLEALGALDDDGRDALKALAITGDPADPAEMADDEPPPAIRDDFTRLYHPVTGGVQEVPNELVGFWAAKGWSADPNFESESEED